MSHHPSCVPNPLDSLPDVGQRFGLPDLDAVVGDDGAAAVLGVRDNPAGCLNVAHRPDIASDLGSSGTVDGSIRRIGTTYDDIGRVQYVTVDDQGCLDAFMTLSRLEGIIPALESAHAVAYAMQLAAGLDSDKTILINLSGRGDKDADFVADYLGL